MNKKEHMLAIERIAHVSGRPLPEVEKKYKKTLLYREDMFQKAKKEFTNRIKNELFKLVERIFIESGLFKDRYKQKLSKDLYGLELSEKAMNLNGYYWCNLCNEWSEDKDHFENYHIL